MKRWGLLAIFLVGCGGDTDNPPAGGDANNGGDGGGSQTDGGPRPDAPGGVGEPAELMGITLAHNEARADIVTTPALEAMQWDSSLAQTAATWAAMCRDQDASGLIDHNPNRSDGHPFYVGENIFASSGQADPQQAVALWMSEKQNYDYDNNTCNGSCGHYTQVVWRESVKLGCAVGNCPGHTYPNSIICNYGPGGNVNNRRPY